MCPRRWACGFWAGQSSFTLLWAYFPFPGAGEGQSVWGGMGLDSRVLRDQEERQNQACSLPYSVGFPGPMLAQPGVGEVVPAGGLQAGENPPAVQDHIFPSHPACHEKDQWPTSPLGPFTVKPGDGESRGSRRGRTRTQEPRILPSAVASLPHGLPLLVTSPRELRPGGAGHHPVSFPGAQPSPVSGVGGS